VTVSATPSSSTPAAPSKSTPVPPPPPAAAAAKAGYFIELQHEGRAVGEVRVTAASTWAEFLAACKARAGFDVEAVEYDDELVEPADRDLLCTSQEEWVYDILDILTTDGGALNNRLAVRLVPAAAPPAVTAATTTTTPPTAVPAATAPSAIPSPPPSKSPKSEGLPTGYLTGDAPVKVDSALEQSSSKSLKEIRLRCYTRDGVFEVEHIPTESTWKEVRECLSHLCRGM
jgi:hypothetical protein